jgi:hypothetical protein
MNEKQIVSLRAEGGFSTAEGQPVPFHLVCIESDASGKITGNYVLAEQLADWLAAEAAKAAAREAGKAAREASNAKFLARPRLVVANEGGEL